MKTVIASCGGNCHTRLHEGPLGTPQGGEVMAVKASFLLCKYWHLITRGTDPHILPCRDCLHPSQFLAWLRINYRVQEIRAQVRYRGSWYQLKNTLDQADVLTLFSPLRFSPFSPALVIFLWHLIKKNIFPLNSDGCTENYPTQSFLCVSQVGKRERGFMLAVTTAPRARVPPFPAITPFTMVTHLPCHLDRGPLLSWIWHLIASMLVGSCWYIT